MEQSVLASDIADRRLGTRFWIFPQAPFVPGYEEPERVWLPILSDEISPGPSDIRMYVVDPLFDKEPYSLSRLPPFDGPRRPPVYPGPDRHFDHLDPQSRSFLSVHAYACVNFTLAVWESFLGHRIRWFFEEAFERLEIVAVVDWENAHSGYQFLELGYSDIDGVRRPYALNFDTIAHEVAHFIVLSELGLPINASPDAEFFPYSESIADLIALISFLHFDTAIDRLLRRTRGNLLLQNELNRIVETSPNEQIRRASNFRRMSEVTREPHDRSLPFTGAIFDCIVEFFHRALVEAGVTSSRLLDTDLRDLSMRELNLFEEDIAAAFRVRPFFFKSALIAARDIVGQALANSFRNLNADTLSFADAADAVVSAAGRVNADVFRSNFAWRQIDTRPPIGDRRIR